MKIAVAVKGCVGLYNAVLLAQHHEVNALDLIPERVALINYRKSPVVDAEVEDLLTNDEFIHKPFRLSKMLYLATSLYLTWLT